MNPSDITAYLDRLCIESKIKGLELIACGYSCEDGNVRFIAVTRAPDYVSEFARTPEEAIAKVRAKIKTPAQVAAAKRDAAQKPILEAAVLDQEGAEVPAPASVSVEGSS